MPKRSSTPAVIALGLAALLALESAPSRAWALGRPSATTTTLSELNARLTAATERGQVDEMRRQLDLGASANFRRTNVFQYPLLLLAALSGHPGAVSLLLDRGADPEARDLRGTPVVVSAASLVSADDRDPRNRALLEAIRLLLVRGRANPNATDQNPDGDDRGALHLAAANGSSRLVELLLTHGAAVDLPNRYRETPLYFAAERGNFEAAVALIRHRADPNSRTRFTEMTPLMAAAESGYTMLVRLLLGWHADPGTHDTFGKTPLVLAEKAQGRRLADEQKRRLKETVEVLRRAMVERVSKPRES